jgi:cytochrome P450
MATRKSAQPLLNPEALRSNSITDFTRLRSRALELIPLDRAFDPFDVACEFCSQNIGLLTLGDGYSSVANDFKMLLDLLGPVTGAPFKSDAPWQRVHEDRAMAQYKQLRAKITALVDAAAANAQEGTVLHHLVHKQDLAKDNIVGFLIGSNLAGHAVPAASVAWSCYLLEKHPEEKLRLLKDFESNKAIVRTKGTSTYLMGVLKESLRLFPPTWLLKRDMAGEGEGQALARGAKYVMISSIRDGARRAHIQGRRGFPT